MDIWDAVAIGIYAWVAIAIVLFVVVIGFIAWTIVRIVRMDREFDKNKDRMGRM